MNRRRFIAGVLGWCVVPTVALEAPRIFLPPRSITRAGLPRAYMDWLNRQINPPLLVAWDDREVQAFYEPKDLEALLARGVLPITETA